MKKGFTLIELLVVVLIIGILSGIALPNYTRSVEKARATEAMNMIKSINEAVYAYAAEHNKCPASFSKVLISIPGAANSSGTEVTAKYFTYQLNKATNALIPGTNCGGVVASRNTGTYNYVLWNPYKIINADTRKRTLACTGTGDRSIGLCQNLGIYTTEVPF